MPWRQVWPIKLGLGRLEAGEPGLAPRSRPCTKTDHVNHRSLLEFRAFNMEINHTHTQDNQSIPSSCRPTPAHLLG